MNPKNTWRWLAVAAVLVTSIVVEHRLRKPPPGPLRVLPEFSPTAATRVRVQPAGQLAIQAEHTNSGWRLIEPIAYPAENAKIESLLTGLETLAPTLSITPAELKSHPEANDEFGFNPPQASIIIEQGGPPKRIWIGARNAPGTEVYLQVVGVEGIYAVDAAVLKLIPKTSDDWRDPAMADLRRLAYDRVIVTNVGKSSFELRLNPTNKLWRIFLPGWNTRADSSKVEEALQQLQKLRADQFCTDNPKADLDAFGLQPPQWSLTLADGTNSELSLDFGKSPTNNPAQIYARRSDQQTIVTVPKDILAAWTLPYEGFRDQHLLTSPGPWNSIHIHGKDDFTLQSRSNGGWTILPQNFAADSALVSQFLTNLTDLQVGFFKDEVVPNALPAKGLAPPTQSYVLEGALTNELDFGTNQDDKVFARRTDEPSSLYTVKSADLQRLPSASWEMRERRLWTFTNSDVTSLTFQLGGTNYVLLRHDVGKWSFGTNTVGVLDEIDEAALDELVLRLGSLSADAWIQPGKNPQDYGFSSGSPELELDLVNGSKRRVKLGGVTADGIIFAMAQLDNKPWIFEFPRSIFLLVDRCVHIAAKTP